MGKIGSFSSVCFMFCMFHEHNTFSGFLSGKVGGGRLIIFNRLIYFPLKRKRKKKEFYLFGRKPQQASILPLPYLIGVLVQSQP